MNLTKLFVFCAVLLVGLAAWSQDFPRVRTWAAILVNRWHVTSTPAARQRNLGGWWLIIP